MFGTHGRPSLPLVRPECSSSTVSRSSRPLISLYCSPAFFSKLGSRSANPQPDLSWRAVSAPTDLSRIEASCALAREPSCSARVSAITRDTRLDVECISSFTNSHTASASTSVWSRL